MAPRKRKLSVDPVTPEVPPCFEVSLHNGNTGRTSKRKEFDSHGVGVTIHCGKMRLVISCYKDYKDKNIFDIRIVGYPDKGSRYVDRHVFTGELLNVPQSPTVHQTTPDELTPEYQEYQTGRMWQPEAIANAPTTDTPRIGLYQGLAATPNILEPAEEDLVEANYEEEPEEEETEF